MMLTNTKGTMVKVNLLSKNIGYIFDLFVGIALSILKRRMGVLIYFSIGLQVKGFVQFTDTTLSEPYRIIIYN